MPKAKSRGQRGVMRREPVRTFTLDLEIRSSREALDFLRGRFADLLQGARSLTELAIPFPSELLHDLAGMAEAIGDYLEAPTGTLRFEAETPTSTAGELAAAVTRLCGSVRDAESGDPVTPSGLRTSVLGSAMHALAHLTSEMLARVGAEALERFDDEQESRRRGLEGLRRGLEIVEAA